MLLQATMAATSQRHLNGARLHVRCHLVLLRSRSPLHFLGYQDSVDLADWYRGVLERRRQSLIVLL